MPKNDAKMAQLRNIVAEHHTPEPSMTNSVLGKEDFEEKGKSADSESSLKLDLDSGKNSENLKELSARLLGRLALNF